MNRILETVGILKDLSEQTNKEDIVAMIEFADILKDSSKKAEHAITAAIERTLYVIENTDDVNVYDLKGREDIPEVAFKKLEKMALSILDETPMAHVNLNRLKKLLSEESFVTHVAVYLDRVIANKIVKLNINHIQYHVPPPLYRRFIYKYLCDEKCWKYFLKSQLHMRKDNFLGLLKLSPRWETRVILRSVPCRFAGALKNETYHILSRRWKTKLSDNKFYCSKCNKTKQKTVRDNKDIKISGEKLCLRYLRQRHYWCYQCFDTPLIKIISVSRRRSTNHLRSDQNPGNRLHL